MIWPLNRISKKWNMRTMLCATHAATIEVGPGETTDTCRVSVRLADMSGAVLWAGSQDQLLRNRANEDNYLLDSGKIALLNPAKTETRCEQLPLIPAALGPDTVGSCKPRLVYWEPDSDNEWLSIRDLFGQQICASSTLPIDEAVSHSSRAGSGGRTA